MSFLEENWLRLVLYLDPFASIRPILWFGSFVQQIRACRTLKLNLSDFVSLWISPRRLTSLSNEALVDPLSVNNKPSEYGILPLLRHSSLVPIGLLIP